AVRNAGRSFRLRALCSRDRGSPRRPAGGGKRMSGAWKLAAHAPKPVVQAALAAHEALDDWDAEIILTGGEVAEDRPDDWALEAYLPRRPSAAHRKAIASLFRDGAPKLKAQALPDTDWVSETQKQVAPIRAGRFHVHTRDYPGI